MIATPHLLLLRNRNKLTQEKLQLPILIVQRTCHHFESRSK
jgi:hypothetical protein